MVTFISPWFLSKFQIAQLDGRNFGKESYTVLEIFRFWKGVSSSGLVLAHTHTHAQTFRETFEALLSQTGSRISRQPGSLMFGLVGGFHLYLLPSKLGYTYATPMV